MQPRPQPLNSNLSKLAATASAFGILLIGAEHAEALRAYAGLGTLATQNGTVSGTNTGDQDLTGFQPLDSDLTAIAALATTSFGRSVLIQADAAAVRTLIGAGSSGFSGAFSDLSGIPTTLVGYGITDAQPLDSDLTAIAALTTTSFGRAVLALADATALRAAAALVLGTDIYSKSATDTLISGLSATYQPLDSDLTAIAALTTTSFGRAVLALADASALRTAAGLGTLATQSGTFSGTSSGTNTGDQDLSALQPLDSDLTTIAGLTATTDSFLQSKSSAWAVRTVAQVKTDLSLSGTNSGDQTTVSGNAGTATALQTARNIDGQSFDGTAAITVIAPGTHAATSKATPVDADELPLVDSAASNVLKKLTWANLKATAKTYFDTIYQPLLSTLTSWGAITRGTGFDTAAAINIGSAGAFITFNGDAGTPSAIVATNASGTAASLTAGHVTTNANLTGDVTSSGNASTLANVPIAATHASDLTAVPKNLGGWTKYFVTGSNVNISTTTGTGDVVTGLTTGSLSNATKYDFEVKLDVTNAADANGMKVTVNGGGSGSTLNAALSVTGTAATLVSATMNAIDTLSAAFVTASSINGIVIINGWFKTGATAAVVNIKCAKVTGNTALVLIGSKFQVRKADT